jgi:hypothetical protein
VRVVVRMVADADDIDGMGLLRHGTIRPPSAGSERRSSIDSLATHL